MSRPKTPEKEDPYYPGVNSLKKIKVSPPKAGQMYPDLNDIFGSTSESERPETAMSGESSCTLATLASEAPSLGAAIKTAAAAASTTTAKMPMINERQARAICLTFEFVRTCL